MGLISHRPKLTAPPASVRAFGELTSFGIALPAEGVWDLLPTVPHGLCFTVLSLMVPCGEEREALLIPLCREKSSTAGTRPKVRSWGPRTSVQVEGHLSEQGYLYLLSSQCCPCQCDHRPSWMAISDPSKHLICEHTNTQELWTWDFKIRPFIFGLLPKVTLDCRHIVKCQRKSGAAGDRRRALCCADHLFTARRIGHRTEYCWFCCAG